MIKKIIYSILSPVLFIVMLPAAIQAQSKTIQPKIMVTPKVPDGVNMKNVYDSNAVMRTAISKVNEAFIRQNANMVSFDAKYKEAMANMQINQGAGNSEDIKSLVLQMSGADIYVDVDVTVVKQTQRNLNSVTVILNGYQNGTSNLLGSKEGRSRMNQTEDIGLLTSQALDTITTSFLNLMQIKFDDIHENGQSVYVQLTVAPGSATNFDAEVGNPAKALSEQIEEWLEKHAVNGVYNLQGTTANMMIISDVRIPFKNPANPNSNYTGSAFYSDLNKFLKTLQVKTRREISSNNKILITIL